MSDHIDNDGPRPMLELIDEGHNHLGHIGVDLDPSHPGHEAGWWPPDITCHLFYWSELKLYCRVIGPST